VQALSSFNRKNNYITEHFKNIKKMFMGYILILKTHLISKYLISYLVIQIILISYLSISLVLVPSDTKHLILYLVIQKLINQEQVRGNA
jgi:hypothetical protein